MSKSRYVIGIDFGTDSCRSLVVDAHSGDEVASSVFAFPRWQRGLYCDPSANQFRQHPLDHIEGLTRVVTAALAAAGDAVRANVVGLSIDTTGSTSAPVDVRGMPLALSAEFAENPNAMFLMWKDHTAVQEAADINRLAHGWGGTDFTRYVGGAYSAEWFWSNILWVFRHDAAVRAATVSWVEHCDWLPALLTGTTAPQQMHRSRCAAGHKAMWHEDFGGLPSEDFLVQLDPRLAGLRARLYRQTSTSDQPVGRLTPEWARALGLSTDVIVGVGAFDAHMGAIGAGIEAGTMVKVMGTSTCDILISPPEALGGRTVRGICGQVDGSVLPGLVGLEAGQSAIGDAYAWFRDLIAWPLGLLEDPARRAEIEAMILPALEQGALREPPGRSGVLAIDWFNGRRTPDADQSLAGALFGLSLGADAPRLYRAVVEATAYGARAIVDRFRDEGVAIESVIAIGGVARKSAFIMQNLADVLAMPIRVARSDQAVALGSAMCAAVASGVHATIEQAQRRMACGFDAEYRPEPKAVAVYAELYRRYLHHGALVEAANQRVPHVV
jgi:L-ribulokinase